MQLDVVNHRNEKVGAVDLRDEVFGGRVNADLIWESVVHENASKRRGTHATKNRAIVSGSGKKPWKQKGTGRARVGDIRNPLWRHGGTVFGPQPRSYDFKLPKKVERGALRAALAQKLKDGQLVVVEALAAAEIKTKAAAELLAALGVTGKAAVDRRGGRREAVAVGAQHAGCVLRPERAGHRARHHAGRPRGDDEGCAGEAAGGARLSGNFRLQISDFRLGRRRLRQSETESEL